MGTKIPLFLRLEQKKEKNSVVFGENIMMLHQRLGHIGEKDLQALHGNGMVGGMSNFSLDFYFCEHCLYGK